MAPARKKLVPALLLSVLLTLLSRPAAAADGPLAPEPPAPHYYVPEVPADMEPVEFFLLTGGVGDEVNDRFGHTGIRIHNPADGSDVVFNWGKFSFDQPGFLWKFFRGELTYSMGVRTFQSEVMHYMQMDRRLVMDRLNLTTQQKRRLMEKIAWNSVPENRNFPYQYWYRNCATIPRDDLDEVLEGQLRAKFFAQPTGKVFRDYVRTNLAYVPFVAPSLDILMNGNIDRPITAWEQMFLPAELRQTLLKMPSIDDEGNPVAGTHLLGDEQVLLDVQEAWAPPFNDYLAASLPVVLLALAAGVLLLRRRDLDGAPPAAYRLLGAASVYWGLVAGIFGLTLALNWAFSGHPDGWANVNLLLFWPVDLVFVPLGWALFRRRRPLKDRFPFLHAGKLLCYGHVALFALLCGLAATHVIRQDIWRVAGWFGLPMVLLAGLLAKFGLSAAPEASGVAAAARTDESALSRKKVRAVR